MWTGERERLVIMGNGWKRWVGYRREWEMERVRENIKERKVWTRERERVVILGKGRKGLGWVGEEGFTKGKHNEKKEEGNGDKGKGNMKGKTIKGKREGGEGVKG